MSMQRRRRVRRSVNWKRFFIVLVTFFVLVLGGLALAMFLFMNAFTTKGHYFDFLKNKQKTSVVSVDKHKDQYVFLIMGTDLNTSTSGQLSTQHSRSDTMLVLIMNTKKGTMYGISIPRDSYVPIAGHGNDKITHAHAFGGPQLSVQTVENFLGVDVDHYLEINYEGFQKLVDILGGVNIDVEKKMYYTDPTQNLVINLKPGYQILDGHNALGYVRFRHDGMGDIGRIIRQEKFMKALLAQLKTADGLTKLPEIAQVMPDYVMTDITPTDIIYFASKFGMFKNHDIVTYMVPGTPQYIDKISYWLPDTTTMSADVQSMLDGTYVPAEQRKKDLAEKDPIVKINIQNGCGTQGVAKKLADKLKPNRFETVATGNADNFNYQKSEVHINKGLGKEYTEKIRQALPGIKIVQVDNVSQQADAIIIIGKDMKF